MKKECFVITTYCNTPKKIIELINCINNLKQFNIDILLHAHYPLDLDIQKMVTYYIYDSTNPVIKDGSKSIIRWKWYKTANKLLTIINPDYSYAVMNQWVESMNFLKNKNYDYIHVVNYDTFINDFIFRKHQDFLNDYDIVFEYTGLKPKDHNANEISNKNLICIVYFSIKKSIIDRFVSELTLEKYLQSKDTMLETYIMEVIDIIEAHNEKVYLPIGIDTYKIKKFDDSQFKLYLGDAVNEKLNNRPREEYDVYTTISEANGFDLIKKTYKDSNNIDKDWYFLFGGNNENNKFEIIIFEITKPIDELIININGDITKINNITDKYYSLVTKYSMIEIIKIIDDNKLNIFINGEKSEKQVIEAMKYQGIQQKFE